MTEANNNYNTYHLTNPICFLKVTQTKYLFKMVNLISLIFVITSCQQTVTIETSVATEPIIPVEDLAKSQTDFEKFYQKFISDSVFQINHILWPLKGMYIDYNIEKKWTKENWQLISWDYINDKTTTATKVNETDSMVTINYHCSDCGFSFEMQFKKINQEWMLVQRQENNF